jgi:5-methylcytosine-specific restriction protein A
VNKPDRFLKERGFVDPRDLPVGPNGRPLCRQCGLETAPPRKTFCSDQCVHHWKIRAQGSYAREQVFNRDQGRCQACGLDTEKLRQLLYRVKTEKGELAYLALTAAYAQKTGYAFSLDKHFWEMDHIRPVDWGGGACGLENLQTLCLACHRTKTRRQRRMKSRGRITPR